MLKGTGVDYVELDGIVTKPPADHLFAIPSFQDLKPLVDEIERLMKTGNYPCASFEHP